MNLYSYLCTPKSQKVVLKKQAVKTARKKKPFFNESYIFCPINVFQLQSTSLMNYPEAVNKDVTISSNKLIVHIVSNQKFKVTVSVEQSSKLSLRFNLEEMRNIIIHRKLDQ